MAILFIDGFDWFDNNVLGNDVGRWTTDGTAARHDAITTGLRNGHGRARQIQSGGYMTHTIGQNLTTLHVAFAIRFTVNPSGDTPLIYFTDGVSNNLTVEINNGGNLKVVRQFTDIATGTTAMA